MPTINTQTIAYTDATVNGAKRTYLNKEYADKRLLETARRKLVHAKYGDKKKVPPHQGARVEWRRWNAFDPENSMAGLVEGVTPDSLDLSQAKVETTLKQYGAFVQVSDMLQTTSYDDVIKGSTTELGECMGTVVERVTRNAMCAGTNVQYAGGKASRLSLALSDKLTVAEVRKAVRTLKKANAYMFDTGEDGKSRRPHFICICSPDATYDLQSDALWQDVSKYSNAEQIYSGEIGRLFGVVFVESTEAKVFSQSVLNAVSANTSASTSFVLKNEPTAAAIAYLSTGGNKIKIGTTEYTLASTGSYTAATKTVTLSAAASLTADAIVYSEDAGACDASTKKGIDVHASLVFGAHAYGTVDIGGSGTVETIIKKSGAGDTSDPLNQRATVAGKISAYAATLLNNAWLVRIEHAVSE